MDRRRVLAGVVSMFAVVFAGCTAFVGDEADGVVLTHVELGNASGEPRVFDVMVTHDDAIIHWSDHEVHGEDVIAINSPGEFGRVEVLVRVDDRWSRTDFATAGFSGERVIAVVTYGMVEDDLLRISRRVSDRPTPADT